MYNILLLSHFYKFYSNLENRHLWHINKLICLTWIFEYSISEAPMPEYSEQRALARASSFFIILVLNFVVPD